MIKLFYQDKVILFDTKNNDYPEKDVIFEDKPTIDQVIDRLNGCGNVVLLSEDEDRAFAHFKRDFVLITAAGGLVRNQNEEFLMIHRNDRWDIPKGKLEEGESIEQCAVREVSEETGIDGIYSEGAPFVTQHFYNIYGRWELKRTYWFNMVYDESRDPREQKEFKPQEIEGITACQWLSRMKIGVVTHHSYAAIKEVLKNLIKNS